MIYYNLNSENNAYIAISENDKSIEKAIIPDTYNGLPVTEVRASYECFENLKEIIIGNNVTKTGFGTFNCASLEKIYLGKSVRQISGPFLECINLSDVYFSGTEEEFESLEIITVDESNEIFTSKPVHFGKLGKSSVLTFKDEPVFPYTHWSCVKGKPETVESEKVSYNNSISGLESVTVKEAIDELNAKFFNISDLDSWTSLKHLVRSGKAADLINIGDKFICKKNNVELEWEVIGIDVDIPVEGYKHSLTLQLNQCYDNFPFSVPDATHYTASSLKPGQYYVKMKNYASPDEFFAFTLTENVPVNTHIRISEGTVYVYNKNVAKPYSSFPIDFSSLSENDMTGTKLTGTNYVIHSSMGTVNYKDSIIRQWMNSTEINWWSPLSMISSSPAEYVNIPGFLNGMDEDFLDAVNPVKKRTTLPDGTTVETEDKFFLLSQEEVYGKKGTSYPYYKNNSILSEPDIFADAIRIKKINSADPRHWWLRDSAPGDNGYMRVLTDGGIGPVKAAKILSYGVVPACCIC